MLYHGRTELTTRSLEDFGKVKAIAFQAASSGSYLYPVKVSILRESFISLC